MTPRGRRGRGRYTSRDIGATARVDPEKDVQWAIRTAAESLGFQVEDMTQPRATKMPLGLPDLRMRHRPKRFRCWVEVKRDGGTVSPEQIAWHELERACGGIVIVADCVAAFLDGLTEAGFPIDSR